MALLPEKSILMVTRSGILSHTFPVAITNKAVTINQDIKAIVPSPAFAPRYLAYQLRSLQPKLLRHCSKAGTTVASIETDKLERFPIALAPLLEQQRIANKLDATLARVDACNKHLVRVSPILQRFRQSVLSAAVSGRLTANWRATRSGVEKRHNNVGKNDRQVHEKSLIVSDSLRYRERTTEGPWHISSQWRWANAVDICEFITKGTTPAKEKMTVNEGGVPFIKVYNLTFTGELNFSVEPTFVSINTHKSELKRSVVYPGDVLMNIVGPPLGKVSIVPHTYPEWNINQAIARFRPRDSILPSFLAICLKSPELLTYAVRQAKATAGQFNLTLEICRALPIPLPCKEEQREIIVLVEKLFAIADRLEARLIAARSITNKLTPALLANAFRGELVPQDPDDEPAADLIRRLAASRVARADKPRARRA
jgi:type I restriction enzyme S subunit